MYNYFGPHYIIYHALRLGGPADTQTPGLSFIIPPTHQHRCMHRRRHELGVFVVVVVVVVVVAGVVAVVVVVAVCCRSRRRHVVVVVSRGSRRRRRRCCGSFATARLRRRRWLLCELFGVFQAHP